ncbi:endolytic transglycosylase MltG [uncultured Enterococcus sp.]|uniref:endolytic transglycosylase MltG n=1 Tax=uncultured Enterococcus sp. TaxID=167972 RepID=UPI002009F38C|nr:endolytic transglycosylase MltG [Enterococcus cecorum]
MRRTSASQRAKQKKERRINRRNTEDRIVNKIVTIVVVVLVLIISILGFTVFRYVQSSLNPLNPESDKKVEITIPTGSSNKQIGEILEKGKIIKSGLVFNYYTKFNNLTGFQAGTYKLSANMTLDTISKKLQGGNGLSVADVKLTIPEGFTIEQIADKLADKTKLSKKDFLALMKDEQFFEEMLAKYPKLLESASQAQDVRYRLEGYLFPATYDYLKKMSMKDLVEQMIAKSDAVMQNYYDAIAAKNMTVQQVLTLASLVEKEGVNENDRKNIAQVFYNRLAQNMPLQSDISVLYALNETKETVTIKDTQVESPYNLYLNNGYGPGPFNNPGEKAIQAVLSPIQNDYLYFVADVKTGQVYFAKTLEEHNDLVEKYVNQ